ncbi:MAG: glycosyltransferase [Steroidobacteraceae bacterium]
MRSPRVLMLSDVYFPRVNGVSTSIQTFRKDLDRLGCPSVLVAPEYPHARNDEPGVVRVRSRYFPFDPEDRVIVARELKRAVLALHREFDLLHIQTPFLAHAVGIDLARRLGIPVVETYHTFFEEYFHHYLPFLPRSLLRAAARAISRRQCNAVDAIVAPSPQMAEVLRAYGVRSEIQVIPTGLDLAKLAGGDGARFRAQLGIDRDRPVALTVGRVAFEKNIEFLVSVVNRVRVSIPDILLIIAGEGPALMPLRRRVEQAGLADHVCFVGYLDRNGPLLDCYRSADAFIFGSRTETQGLVLLEAMALGLPVISTAVMGTKSVLDGARGAIVVDEDETQFASALEKVLLDRDLRASLAAQASRFVETHWSSAEMAGRMLELYQGVVSRAPIGSPVLRSAAPT